MAKNLRDRGYGSSMDNYKQQQQKQQEEKQHTRNKTVSTGTASLNLPKVEAPVSTQRMGTVTNRASSASNLRDKGFPTSIGKQEEFNRSPLLQRAYGTYDNYAQGQVVTGSGYHPLSLTNIGPQEDRLRQYGMALNQVYDSLDKKVQALRIISEPTAADNFGMRSQLKEQGKARLAADIEKQLPGAQKLEQDYKKLGISVAGEIMAQQNEYDKWKNSIREEPEIQAEIAQLKQEKEALYNQKQSIGGGTLATFGNPQSYRANGAQQLEQAWNNMDEAKRIDQKIDLYDHMIANAEDELAMSKYFKWQSMANGSMPTSQWKAGTPQNALLDKIVRGNATPEEQQQAIQEFNFNANNTALMSENERETYNKIVQKYGPDAGMQYYYDLENTSLNTRRRADDEKMIRDIMDNSAAGYVGMNALSVLAKPLQAFSHVGQTADMLFGGEMAKDDSYNSFTYLNNAIRNKTAQDITEKMGDTWGKWGAFGYQTAMSMADFLYTGALTGNFGGPLKGTDIAENLSLLLMSSEAAADATMQAKERGLSDGKAYGLGLIAGAAEYVTERVSLETLLEKIPAGKGWKEWAWYGLKNRIAEASEEGASDLINLVADILISKDQSEWEKAVRSYEAQGMDANRAFQQALIDQAESTGMSMLGGWLSGGGMANVMMTANTVSNIAQNVRTITDTKNVERLVNRGMAFENDTEAYRRAEKLKAKLDSGEKISPFEVNKAYNAISDAQLTNEETITRLVDAGKESNPKSVAYKSAVKVETKLQSGEEITAREAAQLAKAVRTAVNEDFESGSAENIGKRLITENGREILAEAAQTLVQTNSRAAQTKGRQVLEQIESGTIDAKTAGETFLQAQQIYENTQRKAENTRTLQPRNVTEGMSELERTAARVGVSEEETARVKAIADLLGADVRYYNQAAERYERAGTRYRRTENGRYDRSTGTIWLNAQSTNPVMTVLSHELTHSLEQTEKYGEFKNLVLALSGDLRKSIEQTYADRGLDAEGIDHEIVARYVEDRLLTDEQAIRDAVNRNRSFGQWMKAQIDKILAKLGNTDAQERVTLQKARDLYAQALKEKAGAQRATEGKLTLPKAGVQESVTEQMDAEYMEAVESGDMETAQRMVDEAARKAGYTIKAYHGTTENFTEFKRGEQGKNHDGYLEFGGGFYFTPSEKEAQEWVYRGRSGLSRKRDAKVMSVYLSADRVLEADSEVPGGSDYLRAWLGKADANFIANRAYRFINYLEEELKFTNTEVQETLKAFGYDAIKATYKNDTMGQYVVFDPEQIKSADPVTYDDNGKPIPLSERFNPENKDIRFSMSEEVEQTDRLIAWHNMNEDALRSALELGGLAMPSWAIKTADRAHTSYGDISVIAPRNLVDPKRNRSSMIFGGDAWTPVFPDVNYKVTRESAEKLENEIKGLVGEYVYRKIGGAALDADNISDQLRRSNGALPGYYRENLLLKYAYLKSLGRDVNLPTKEAELDRFYKFTNDEVRKFAGKLTNGLKTIERFRSMSIDELMQQEDLKQAIAETKEEYYREEMKDPALFEKMRKAGFFTKDLSFSEIDAMLSAAQEYLMQGVEQTIDKREAQDLIDREINKEEFETWALKKLNETVERKGIRNNKELYTPSGNRRSFDALNYEYTLANIVRAMRQQPKQGRTEFLSGPGSVKGAALKSYNDVEQVRAARGRLVDTAEQGKEAYDAYDENLKDILSRMSRRGDLFDAANALIEVLQNAKTERGIYNYMQRELAEWYNVSPELAHDVFNLIGQINKLPMEYFEGKTYDAVGFDETAAVVVPDSMSADLKEKLSEAGANVIEYKAGDNADRLEKVNSVQDAAFSVTEEEDGPRGLQLPMEGPNQQNYTKASWERYDAARNAAQYMIDNARNDAERARGEEAMKAAEKLLQKKSAGSKQETALTGKPIEATKRLTNRLLDMFQIEQLDRAEARDFINQVAKEMIETGEVSEATMGELWARLRYYARGTITPEGQEYFRAIREKLKGRRIYVDQSTRADFGDDWGDFKKRAFAAGIYLTNNLKDQDIRDMSPELSEAFPERFPEGQTDPRLLLEAAVDAAEQGAPQIVPLDEYQRWQEGQTGQSTEAQEDELWDKMRRALEAFSDSANVEMTLRGRKTIKAPQEKGRYQIPDVMKGVYEMTDREMDAAIDLITDDMGPDIIGTEEPSIPKKKNVARIQNTLDSFLNAQAQLAGQTERVPGMEKVSTGTKKNRQMPAKLQAQEAARYIYRKMVDSGEAVSRLGKYTGDKNLYHYYNMARASSNAAVSMIQNAQTNVMGEKVGDGLNKIFEDIRKKGKEYYANLQAYLLHMHNIDRMSRENPGAIVRAQEELAQFRRDNPDLARMADYQIEHLANDPISQYYEEARQYTDILARLRRAEMTRNKPVFGPEVTAEDSQRAVQQLLPALENVDGFQEDVEKIYKYIDNLMQYRIDSGLITEEDYDRLRGIYPHYVPVFYDIEREKSSTKKNNRTEIGSTIGKAKGGTERIIPLHRSLAQQTFSVVREGSKNRFGQRLLEMERDSRGMIKGIEEYNGDFHEDTFDEQEDPLLKKENTFVVRQGGKRWEMNLDRPMYEAISVLSPEPQESNLLTRGIRKLNDLFKELCTGYNPTFLARNFMRDLQDAGLYSKDLSEFTKQYPQAYKEIVSNGKYWQQYKALGGLYSSIFDYQTGELKQSNKLKKYTVDAIETLNMAVEQAPRLAEFMATVKKAERAGNLNMDTLMEAMYNAADVTVNFGRSGKIGQYLNRNFVPFLNPGIQGFDKMVRNVTETKGFKDWARLVTKASVLGIAPAIISKLLFGKRKDWDEIKQRDKDIYYLFPLKDGVWLKLPKGRVLSIFGMATDRAMNMAEGKDGDWGGFITTSLSQTAPANPIQNNIFMPLIETKLFKKDNPGMTWYGTEIESKRLQNLWPGERYDAKTDALSKWLGKKFDLSPAKINYLLDQYTGVVGDVLLPLTSDRAEKDLFSAAFTIDSTTSNRLSEDFYNTKDELTYAKNDPDASAEDELLYKYWNQQASAVSDINKAIRAIEQDKDLSDKEKQELTRVQYELRNEVMRNALDTMKDYKDGGTDNDIYSRIEEAQAQEARESKTYNFKGQDVAWDDLSGTQKKIVQAQDALENDPNADLSEIIGKGNATKKLAQYQAARDQGISNQTYIDALQAIDDADDGNGNYNQAEAKAGLDKLISDGTISEKEASTLWKIITGGADKNNPFPVGAIISGPMGLKLPKIG